MTIAELGEICSSNGLVLSSDQLEQLRYYSELLRKKNQVVNLISRKDEDNIADKHILHSLTLILPQVQLSGIGIGAKVFDLGTGGGLPGIPVKIARPDIQMTVCDSIAKKIAAVKEMQELLRLYFLTMTDRAENIARSKEHKNTYDTVITRAVAPLDDLLQWSAPLLKKNGTLLALKGGNIEEEKLKTKKLSFVESVAETPLVLNGYDGFTKDEKKLVRVTLL